MTTTNDSGPAYTPTDLTSRRPGPGAWARMIEAEAKMVLRDTSGLVIPLGLPLLFLVMQASSASDEVLTPQGFTALELYVLPIVILIVIATIAAINMPSFLASYRRMKILRRLAVTPASPVMVLVAQMTVSFVQLAAGSALAIGVAMGFFGARMPERPLVAVVVLLAAAVAFYAVGMIVASVAKSPNAALTFGLIAFFALAALGGMFGPIDSLPGVLADIARWLPFDAATEALRAAWLDESVPWESWVVLGATTLLGTTVAATMFRWE